MVSRISILLIISSKSIKLVHKKKVQLTPVDKITEVTLSNIKALRSIQVKSIKHPVKLITNRSLQTMRLTTVFGHLDSSIDFNGAVRCKILDVEAGKITSKKSLMLKQGVVMSTSGNIDLKTVVNRMV